MIYVLAYPSFDPAVTDHIARFRSAHEPERARLVPPHITLVFGLDRQHLPDLTARCSELATLIPAFPVTFAATQRVFDPFDRTHKLFLICAAGAERLTALHDRLYQGALQSLLNPDHPFRPHMTVASHPNQKTIARLDPSALGHLPIACRISALHLVKLTHGTLDLIATFPLQPETSHPFPVDLPPPTS